MFCSSVAVLWEHIVRIVHLFLHILVDRSNKILICVEVIEDELSLHIPD